MVIHFSDQPEAKNKEDLLVEGHNERTLGRPAGTEPDPDQLRKYPTKALLFAGAIDDSDLSKSRDILTNGLYASVGTATMSSLNGTRSTPYSWATYQPARFGLITELTLPTVYIQKERENRGEEIYFEINENIDRLRLLKDDDIRPLYPDDESAGTYVLNPKFITGAWLVDNVSGNIYYLGSNSQTSLRNLNLFTEE